MVFPYFLDYFRATAFQDGCRSVGLPVWKCRHRSLSSNVVTIANTHMTRRESLLAVAAPVVSGISGIVNGAPTPSRKLNVVCVGGHPDHPESGCGGTLARYSARGHNVTMIYLTRGEAGAKQGRSRHSWQDARRGGCHPHRRSLESLRCFGRNPGLRWPDRRVE